MPLDFRSFAARALLVLAVLIALLAVAHPAPLPPPRPTPTPIVVPPPTVSYPLLHTASPEYAIQAFLYWHLDAAERDLDLVKDMGFGWVKQGFAWRDIEGYKGAPYDWYRTDYVVNLAEKRGLKIIARIDRQPFWAQADGGAIPLANSPPADYADYGRFCHDIAERYRGRIPAYQVWNEPNLSREWGDRPPNAGEYAQLLKVCYEAIKSADPNAIVISAPLAPTGTDLPVAIPDDVYFQQMYDAGAKPYFDMLGVNAPGYLVPPQTDPAEVAANDALGGHRWNSFRHVEDIRAIMTRNGDADKQIAVLEMGWTTDPIHPDYAWFAVTEQQQADYLAGAYRWAREHWTPWIGIMTTIYIADPEWTQNTEQYWWAITLPDYPETRMRPAYWALKRMQK
ncbi:MAG: hypothetical protein HY023_06695 [Chloroflexi bacterium]|nr:hypothetical protein [Chloroflexota bacterium]